MNIYGTFTTVRTSLKTELTINSQLVTSGVITESWQCATSDLATHVPAVNTTYPTNANYILTNASVRNLTAALSEYTLTYATNFDSLPSTTVIEQSSREDIPIKDNPHYDDSWATSKAGVDHYIGGTTTVTVTEYFDSQPSSNRAHIGKIQSPGGGYSEENGWLVIGTNRQQQGIFWMRVTTYLFSAIGWDTDIYDAV